MKKKICAVSGSRAEYGVLKPVLKAIDNSPNLELLIVATAMHLSKECGNTVSEIIDDGFTVHERVEMPMFSDDPIGIGKSIGHEIINMVECLRKMDPDIVLICGDRYEIFAVATAAMALNYPIAHISGGEITEGAVDEQIRHAITKMSHIHLVALDENAERVIQMGEEPWRVHTVGGPWADNIVDLDYLEKKELEDAIGIKLSEPTVLVTYHPVTLYLEDTKTNINNLLSALDEIDAQIIFTYPNADAGRIIIIKAIEKFVETHSNASVFKSFGSYLFLNLLSKVDILVGNSSSGMSETQSFKLPVVNIGNRQKGRIITDNIICTGEKRNEILAAIKKSLCKEFKSQIQNMGNPYYKGGAAKKIEKILSDIELGPKLIIKQFRRV